MILLATIHGKAILIKDKQLVTMTNVLHKGTKCVMSKNTTQVAKIRSNNHISRETICVILRSYFRFNANYNGACKCAPVCRQIYDIMS